MFGGIFGRKPMSEPAEANTALTSATVEWWKGACGVVILPDGKQAFVYKDKLPQGLSALDKGQKVLVATAMLPKHSNPKEETLQVTRLQIS